MQAIAMVATVGIGNQWVFDNGITIGADWFSLSAVSNSTSSVRIKSNTGLDPVEAEDEYNHFIKYELLDSGILGLVIFYFGYSF